MMYVLISTSSAPTSSPLANDICRRLQAAGDEFLAHWVLYLIWAGLVGATFLLLRMLVSRWGDSQLTMKALTLSLLVHLVAGLWTTTVRLATAVTAAQRPESISIRKLVNESESHDQRSPGTVRGQTPVWERLPGSPTVKPLRHSRAVAGLTRPEIQEHLPNEAVDDSPRRLSDPDSMPLPADPPTISQRATETEPAARRAGQAQTELPSEPADARPEATAEDGKNGETSAKRFARMARRNDTDSSGDSAPPLSINRNPSAIAEDLAPVLARAPGSPDASFEAMRRDVVPTLRGLGDRSSPYKTSGTPIANMVVRGVVRDSKTGLPLPSTTIRLDLAHADPIVTRTREDGTYELELRLLPENVAVSATRRGYVPYAQNLRVVEGDGRVHQLDFALRASSDRVIALENNPAVHHLGNNQFEGSINSQFQQASEGETFTAKFSVTAQQLSGVRSRVVLTLLTKGVQCPPQIRLNGKVLKRGISVSPDDGSFGDLELPFDPSWLRVGENVIQIRAVNCNGDLDDFEFVNLQVHFTR